MEPLRNNRRCPRRLSPSMTDSAASLPVRRASDPAPDIVRSAPLPVHRWAPRVYSQCPTQLNAIVSLWLIQLSVSDRRTIRPSYSNHMKETTCRRASEDELIFAKK